MSNRRKLRPRVHRLRESATAVIEAPPLPAVTPPAPAGRVTFAEAVNVQRGSTPGRLLVKLIKAGWNKAGSRYYPAKVLERDGPKVATAGTLNFVDHATEAQEYERPEGSIKDLASVQLTDAYWDPNQQALMAEVRLFAPWREAITDMAEHIGMSIRADGVGELGEAEGKAGLIINELTRMHSVDYVTRPGAGGGIVSVLESARAVELKEARNIGAWIESRLHLTLTQIADECYGDGRLTRDERIVLSKAIGEGLQAWTSVVDADAPQLFVRDLYDEPQAPVAVAESQPAAPTGPSAAPEPAAPPAAPTPNPEPAVPGDPVTDGAPPTAPNPPEEEPAMTGTQTGPAPGMAGTATAVEAAPTLSAEARAQIAESALREAEARTTTLQTQLATITAERDTARTELRRVRNVEAARGAVASALGQVSDLPAPARTRIAESLTATPPTTDTGDVDTAALNAAVTRAVESERAYIASIREAAGEGTPSGLGGSAPVQDIKAWESDVASRFQRLGHNDQGAVLAARR